MVLLLFHFSVKKLPLEALEITFPTKAQPGQFCQKGRLGPPESEEGLDPSRQKLEKAEIPGQKQ